MGRLHTLLAELKRRNVIRAALLYIGGVWALAQGIAQLGPLFHAPDWAMRWFIIACVIAFPLWVAFAWLYAWTPQGFKREDEVGHDPALRHDTSRKLDVVIIGVLAIAVVLLATNQFVRRDDATSRSGNARVRAAQTTLTAVPARSVAVLPFANEGGDPDRQYFSDGLSEELISDLTQLNGLKVIGKYSSFKFRGAEADPAEIGATLGVAYLIEGSVRQAGSDLRIVVNLIRARDGTNVWSHTYDEKLKEVFAIQRAIGEGVADALKVKLLGHTPGVDEKPPGGDVEAYRLMLQGRAAALQTTEAGFRRAIELYRQAAARDPAYAYARSRISNTEVNLGLLYLHGDAQQAAYTNARKAADQVTALAPDSAIAHFTRGYIFGILDRDAPAALAEYQKAYARAPNDPTIIVALALGYTMAGHFGRAAELYRKAGATDPLRADVQSNLAFVLAALGQLDAAQQAAEQAVRLQPGFGLAYTNLARIELARGDWAAAKRWANQLLATNPEAPRTHSMLAQIALLQGDQRTARSEAARETDPDEREWVTTLVAQADAESSAARVALDRFVVAHAKDQPTLIAMLYSVRGMPDAVFEWLERARAAPATAPALKQVLLTDPFLLRYKDDPRFAQLCRELDLPLPGAAPSPADGE